MVTRPGGQEKPAGGLGKGACDMCSEDVGRALWPALGHGVAWKADDRVSARKPRRARIGLRVPDIHLRIDANAQCVTLGYGVGGPGASLSTDGPPFGGW